jgi:hypothetical protein
MDEDDVRVRYQGLQPGIYGILSFGSSGNDAGNFLETESLYQFFRKLNPISRGSQNNDLSDFGTDFKLLKGLSQKGSTAHWKKGFGDIFRHPSSPAGCRNEGGYTHFISLLICTDLPLPTPSGPEHFEPFTRKPRVPFREPGFLFPEKASSVVEGLIEVLRSILF